MSSLDLNEINITPLRQISAVGGDVMHAIKKSESDFAGFGELYFSWVNNGAIKGWKRHNRMTMNIVVPIGSVRFVFFTNPSAGNFREIVIGKNNYVRLRVPPRIWFGFQGLESPQSLVMNFANIEHDFSEADREPLSVFNYNWVIT